MAWSSLSTQRRNKCHKCFVFTHLAFLRVLLLLLGFFGVRFLGFCELREVRLGVDGHILLAVHAIYECLSVRVMEHTLHVVSLKIERTRMVIVFAVPVVDAFQALLTRVTRHR
jgi:hypothetical protein